MNRHGAGRPSPRPGCWRRWERPRRRHNGLRLPDRVRLAAAAAALVLTCLVVAPAVAAAQESAPGGHHKWLSAAIGAVVVGVPTFLAGDFDARLGSCTKTECFAPVATLAGFTLGFLLGKEFDDAAARRFVAGPRLDLRPEGTVQLPFVPDRGRAAGVGALFTGAEGLVFLAGGTQESLGGIRGLADAALMQERAAIVAATGSGLFALPPGPGDTPGRRVDARGARRVAAGPGGAVVVAGAGGLLGFTTQGQGTGLRFSEAARTTGSLPAADLLWPEESELVWVLAGGRLIAREGGTLTEVGAIDLPATARSLDVHGPLGLVAAGVDGVYVVDVSDPTRPRLTARYQGVRNARDGALLESRAYIAAGQQGLVVLDLARPAEPVVAAVVRNLGSPSLVLRGSGQLWVVDGTTGEAHSVSPLSIAPPGW